MMCSMSCGAAVALMLLLPVFNADELTELQAQQLAQAGTTCNVPPSSRIQCGRKNIWKWACFLRGCCWDTSVSNVPRCFRRVQLTTTTKPTTPATTTALPNCNVGHPTNRVDCGFPGVDERTCRQSGCCWDTKVSGVPWCFYGVETTTTYVTTQKPAPNCDVGHPSTRADCGYPGISAKICSQRNCCWDDSYLGVPWCFYGKESSEEPELNCYVGHPSKRLDCGYPGIQPNACRQRKCCWDQSIAGVPWCFHGKICRDNNDECLQYGEHSTSIPAKCCAVPYTLSGGLYRNCTINMAVSNQFGCYNSYGHWVKCQQPHDFVAEYKETFSTALSAEPGVAVPLLAINCWILMQRKVTGGSVSFKQNWATYRDGFGSATGNDNYWLGLEKVQRLTRLGVVSLRVEIQRTTGLWYSAQYSPFSISDEAAEYQLVVDGYSGDAGDALSAAQHPDWNSNGMRFSTVDNDNDVFPAGSCAWERKSGWWYRYCTTSAINSDSNGMWTTGTPVNDIRASHMLVKLNE